MFGLYIIHCAFFVFSFRYFGDDNKENKHSDEKAKLAVLLSKIEERKKQKEAGLNSKSSDSKCLTSKDTDDPAVSIKSYAGEEDDEKKKRHRNVDSPDGKATGENEVVAVSEKEGITKKKKKKHKRKWKESHDSEESEGSAIGNIETKTGEKDGFTVIGTDKFKKKQKVCLY